jgi:Ribonuclease G/E
MKKEMLINVLQPEECRIAIVEDGVLEELYVERSSQESYVGNIYKGRIVNIEPSIQAAFVDFGIGRNGFLHVSDVDPAYYRHIQPREAGRRGPRGDDRGRGGRGRGRDDRGSDDRRPRDSGERAPRPPHHEPAPEPVAWPAETFEAAPAPSSDERPFGAGIFDDDAPPAAEGFAGSIPAETNGGEEGPVKRKRRRGRRRRGDKGGDAPGAAGGSESGGDEPPPLPGEFDDGDPPPRLESAERRTGEDDESFAGSLEPSGGGGRDDDDDAGHMNVDAAYDAVAADVESDEHSRDDDDDDADESDGNERSHGDDDDDAFDGGDEDNGAPPRARRDRRHGFQKKRLGRDGDGRPKPLIQDIFKRGQEVLVQVIKEGIGTKGPTLSTYISIAGRYLVLMPGLKRIGVSRKIADDEKRRRLKAAAGRHRLHHPHRRRGPQQKGTAE